VPLGTHLFQLIFLVFTGYSCFFRYFTPCFTICHWILRLFSYLSGNISTFHWALMFPRLFYSECYKLYLDYFSYSSQNMTRFHWVLVFPQKFYMKFYKLWLGTHVSSCILLWMLQVVIWYWDYIITEYVWVSLCTHVSSFILLVCCQLSLHGTDISQLFWMENFWFHWVLMFSLLFYTECYQLQWLFRLFIYTSWNIIAFHWMKHTFKKI
jgi:hypothetical protein